MAGIVELEIPARPDFLAVARLVVAASAAAEAAFDDDRIADLRLAVSEACTNAMEATWRAAGVSPPFDDDDPAVASLAAVRVRCEASRGRVEVDVIDDGAGFDPDALAVHPAPADPRRLNHERGLGIPLIRVLADEVRFEPTPTGTSVHMVLEAN
jgi:serine/threonine-protein kinase RsbW